MKVLLVSYMEAFAPCGVRTYYQLLQAGLASAGHEVRVLTPLCAPRTVRWVTGGLRRILGTGGKYADVLATEWKHWWRVRSALRSLAWSPDIVHAQDVGSGSAVLQVWGARCPLIVTAHFNEDPVEECLIRCGFSANLPARSLRRLVSRQFRGPRSYVAPSLHAAECLRRLVPEGAEISVIPNACDFATIGMAKPATDITDAAKHYRHVVLSAGTLEPRKDPWFLLELATALTDRRDILFLHAGDGPLRSELEAAIASRRLSNLKLLGQRPDMAAVMKAAQLFIHFPLYETFGLVVIEGIAAGVPVVARQVGGIQDVLGGLACGGLYEPQASAATVGEGIVRLLEDSDRRKQVVAEQYQSAIRRFDTAVFIRSITEAYRRLVESAVPAH